MSELRNEYETELIKLSHIKDVQERNSKVLIVRKQFFTQYDQLLDTIEDGPAYLLNEHIAQVVCDELHRFDGQFYNLIAYTVMSNHVHILIDTSFQVQEINNTEELSENYTNLDQIMKRIKGPTAVYSNRILNRKGQFWERESYDMYIRNEKMKNNVIAYILNNPVKAGIVSSWESYKWNHLIAL